jgi:hypothetical protein
MTRASNGHSAQPSLGRHGTGISLMKTGRLTDAFSLLVLVLALALDAVPRFALGDSESYLSTQLHGYLPDDRSWAYGLAAGFLIRVTQDLSAVAIVQIAISWVSAMLLGYALARHFRLGPWFRLGVLLVVFANPLSFFWIRAFMTDGLAAAAFGALIALLFAERGIALTAAGIFILALGICALRSVYLPPLLAAFGAVAALRLLSAVRAWRRRDAEAVALRHAAARYTVLAVTVLLSLIGYAALNAQVLHRHEISTNYATTRFLVSAWSPLMEQPLAALGLPATVTDHMTPLTYENRLGAAFLDDGIVERLHGYYGSYEAAAPAYRRLMHGAVFDRPLDFLALMASDRRDRLWQSGHIARHAHRQAGGLGHLAAPRPEHAAGDVAWTALLCAGGRLLGFAGGAARNAGDSGLFRPAPPQAPRRRAGHSAVCIRVYGDDRDDDERVGDPLSHAAGHPASGHSGRPVRPQGGRCDR